MLKLHIAISLATVLGLGIPASAQAQTAVDDFEVTLNITPQTSDTMQIVGLEDVLFSEQVYSQPDPLNPTGTYGGWYLKDAAFPDVYLPVSIIFASPTDPSLSALNPNDSYISPPSSSACSAASGPTEAHTIHVGASLVGVDPAQTPAPPGHYSQQFTLLLEPE
jgi:hypothetical protein